MGIRKAHFVILARLLEGRVAILVDGTPVACAVSLCRITAGQEDYFKHFALHRLTVDPPLPILEHQYTGDLLGLWHIIDLDSQLAVSISASRQGSVPTVIEIFMMGLIFEIMRGGVRLPGPIISRQHHWKHCTGMLLFKLKL